MFARIKRHLRAHGPLLSVQLVDTYRNKIDQRQDNFGYIASIRESDTKKLKPLFNFWQKVFNIFHENDFIKDERDKFYKSIGRHIPRPCRIIGRENEITFYFYRVCRHSGKKKKR